MKLLKFSIALFLFATIIVSCKKKLDCCVFPTEDVMLRWDGEPALDGCGFIFVFSDQTERKVKDETTIDNSFKSNSPTSVEIEYELTGEILRSCFAPTEFEEINLISIERK